MTRPFKASNEWTKEGPNGLVTHGSTEPILSVLDYCGFEIKDMFLIGINQNCGTIVLPSKERAEEAKRALEPAYAVKVQKSNTRWETGTMWEAKYDRREMDGTERNWFVTEIVLKDGTVVMKDGRWLQ